MKIYASAEGTIHSWIVNCTAICRPRVCFALACSQCALLACGTSQAFCANGLGQLSFGLWG